MLYTHQTTCAKPNWLFMAWLLVLKTKDHLSALYLSHLHLISDLGGSSAHVIRLTKTDPRGPELEVALAGPRRVVLPAAAASPLFVQVLVPTAALSPARLAVPVGKEDHSSNSLNVVECLPWITDASSTRKPEISVPAPASFPGTATPRAFVRNAADIGSPVGTLAYEGHDEADAEFWGRPLGAAVAPGEDDMFRLYP